jgi:hypothetical protein
MISDSDVTAEIKKRLPEDVILWTGSPRPMGYAIHAMKVGLFTDKIGCFALTILALMLSLFSLVPPGSNRGGLILSITVLASIGALAVLVNNFIKGHRVIYAITNKRLVILTKPWLWIFESLESYTPEKLTLSKSPITTATKSSLDFSVKSVHYRGRFINYPVGFWAIDDVKRIEEIIRHQFRINES